jgi:hypothetical protein
MISYKWFYILKKNWFFIKKFNESASRIYFILFYFSKVLPLPWFNQWSMFWGSKWHADKGSPSQFGGNENKACNDAWCNSFLQMHSAAAPRTSHGNLHNYTEPKPFSWVKPVLVRFSSSILTVQDHILSTAGDALKLRQGPTQHHQTLLHSH